MAQIPVTADGPEDARETLFFIHGWPDNQGMWDDQVAYLVPRGYRCLRVTMPHFSGRERAKELGDDSFGFPDWDEAANLLAGAIRREAKGPVTLVIHDWGCVWGFTTQLLHPELVKAIVAMDVGTPTPLFSAQLSNVPKLILIGVVYQYWLASAHILGRAATAVGFGQFLGDWMTQTFAGFAKWNFGKSVDFGGESSSVTSDAGYPYYITHRNFFLEMFGLKSPIVPESLVPSPKRDPDCPLLFFWGGNKPAKFHDWRWERELKRREDCEVVKIPAGHWLSTEQPAMVNEKMAEWLGKTLPSLHPMKGIKAAL
jgi:pimeloyl-ACP methyl ester carboxylesterase